MTTYDGRPSPFTQLTTTADWESVFSAAGIFDGIDGTTGGALAPSLDSVGRNAVIQSGNVILKGALWRCDAPVNTPIPVASAQNRIDRLVIQINRAAATSPTYVQPVVITGTPGGSPVEPPLVQNPTGIYQIPVCSWTSQSNGALSGLTDERWFSVDVWHSFVVPTSPAGLTGSFRYKMMGWKIVRFDVSLVWTAAQSWTIGPLLPPYLISLPAGINRVYPNMGNATFNVSANTQIPRLYFTTGGVINFITPAAASSGTGSWNMDIPAD